MSLMNRLGNAKNPYQGESRKVLCVCSAGLLRSPTAANILHAEYGFNTRAAGCSQEYALIPVDEVLLEWADEVVFMEQSHADNIFNRFPTWTGTFVVLDIPDNFGWNHPVLRDYIKQRYEESLLGTDDTSSSD